MVQCHWYMEFCYHFVYHGYSYSHIPLIFRKSVADFYKNRPVFPFPASLGFYIFPSLLARFLSASRCEGFCISSSTVVKYEKSLTGSISS